MKLPLATRIFLGYAVLTLAFGAVSIFAVLQLRSIGDEIRLVSEGYLPLTRVTAQIETYQKNRQRDTERLLEEREPEIQRALIKLARLYFPQLVRDKLASAIAIARVSRTGALREDRRPLDRLIEQYEALARLYDEYETTSNALFTQIEASGQASRAGDQLRAVSALEGRIDREIKSLTLVVEARVAERVASVQERERRSAWTIMTLSLVAIALGFGATLLAGKLLAPIRPLTRAVTRFGQGDYAVALPTSGGGEIALLAREFDAMARNIRERERELAEKQTALVRAERLAAIGRVSAQITHEIRNPLTSLGLNAELLEESLAIARFPTDEEKVEASQLLTAISQEADRLTEITEQYLKFARFPKPVLAAEEINPLVELLLDFLAEEHARARVGIVRALAPGLPAAICDRGQLRQALMNLLRNSREVLVHGGTIEVATRALVTQVEITVSDDGPGIPAPELERLFDPFFSTKERGTGLGLALTQQIIAEQGGEIRATSEVGRGTRFTICLPRAPAPRSSP